MEGWALYGWMGIIWKDGHYMEEWASDGVQDKHEVLHNVIGQGGGGLA